MRYTIFLYMLVLVVALSSLLANGWTNKQSGEFERVQPIFAIESGRQQTREDDWIDERSDDGDDMCPDLWFVRGKFNDSKCHCGANVFGTVQCDPQTREVSVIDCYCITYKTTTPVVGSCFFNCVNNNEDRIYHRAPSNCSRLNRDGTLCGKCQDGHALPAYSYDLKCMKCDNDSQNWWLYVIYAFLPLTLFIVIILVLRINVVAPKLYVFVFSAQNISMPIILRVMVATASLKSGFLLPCLATVYGIWNLDFFRLVLPNVCLNLIPLHTLALDYLIALYPMLLMGVAYVIVELHGYGFRPVLYLWRPFHRLFAQFRRHWGIQSSIMDTFVTFFVLSTTKLFSVSFDLLIPTRLFTPEDKSLGLYLFYDPNIKYFASVHLPYALLAVTILTTFIVFPLFLLLCYQCRVCQKCLTRSHLRGRTLDEFVNTFQRYYRDGSDGTSDCRWFAGVYIIFRAAAFFTYAVSLSAVSNILLVIVCIVGAAILLMVQPYNEEYSIFNTVDANFILLQALFFASMVHGDLSALVADGTFSDAYIGVIVISVVPLVYITGVVVHRFLKRRKCSGVVEEDVGPLPDRLLHSDQYRDSFGYIAAESRHMTSQPSDGGDNTL